jgi:hypothetical protein
VNRESEGLEIGQRPERRDDVVQATESVLHLGRGFATRVRDEPRDAGVDEKPSVRPPEVDRAPRTRFEDVERLIEVVHANLLGEVVTRPERKHTQGHVMERIGPVDASNDLVDGAVAARGDDRRRAAFGRFCGQRNRIPLAVRSFVAVSQQCDPLTEGVPVIATATARVLDDDGLRIAHRARGSGTSWGSQGRPVGSAPERGTRSGRRRPPSCRHWPTSCHHCRPG